MPEAKVEAVKVLVATLKFGNRVFSRGKIITGNELTREVLNDLKEGKGTLEAVSVTPVVSEPVVEEEITIVTEEPEVLVDITEETVSGDALSSKEDEVAAPDEIDDSVAQPKDEDETEPETIKAVVKPKTRARKIKRRGK